MTEQLKLRDLGVELDKSQYADFLRHYKKHLQNVRLLDVASVLDIPIHLHALQVLITDAERIAPHNMYEHIANSLEKVMKDRLIKLQQDLNRDTFTQYESIPEGEREEALIVQLMTKGCRLFSREGKETVKKEARMFAERFNERLFKLFRNTSWW